MSLEYDMDSLWLYMGVVLLGHMIYLELASGGAFILIFKVVAPVCISSGTEMEFPFLYINAITCYFLFAFYLSHSDQREIVICICPIAQCVEHF